MKTDWKVGDKCWWFDNLMHEIKSGVIEYTDGCSADVMPDGIEKSNGSRNTIFLMAFDIHPTREALCEYYRKIFE